MKYSSGKGLRVTSELCRLRPGLVTPILLTAILLSGSAAFGQQRIIGVVTDKNSGRPIPGASIKLDDDSSVPHRVANTDADGRFALSVLSPGSYILTIEAGNFYKEQLSFSLAPRGIQQVHVELAPVAAVNEQVTVHSEPRLIDETQSSTASAIGIREIESLPASRRTQLSDIITPFVPAAVASHDNLVHLRGNELSLNTFVNGVSFFDNPHQLFTPGLSPDIIQSVNVITGGFPAEFGNRFGGILDIVTRSGFDANNHGSITFGIGDYLRDNAAFDFGGHTDRLGYFLYGQVFQSDRFLNTPEPRRFHDRGRGSRGFAQIDYRPGSSDFFKLTISGDGTNFELPNTTEDEARNRDFFQRNREQTTVLSWEHLIGSSAAVSSSIYERFVSSRLMPTSDSLSIEASGLRNDITIGAKSDYSVFIGSRHAIKTGIDLMQFRLREDFSFDPRDADIETEPFEFRGRRTGGQASAYVQDQLKPFQNFTANLGLRYDQYSLVTSGHALSPRINLAYALNSGHTVLHFAYNRFFAAPPIENLLLSANLGFENNPPRISRSNHFEAGVTRAIADHLVIRLTGYLRNDKNSFETTELANVRIFAPTTFEKGKAYGIEFSARVTEIKRIGLSGYLNYAAQRAFQTGPVSGGFTVENIEAGEKGAAAFDQIHTLAGGLTWRERKSGFWASGAIEYGSGTPAAPENGDGVQTIVRLPDHFVSNFYFGLDLFRKERSSLELQFNIENATNRVFAIAKESEFTPIQFSPPRFLSGSLKVRF